MADFNLPLQVRPPPVSDLSTSMLNAYRLRQMRAEEGLLPLKTMAARNDLARSSLSLRSAQQRQGALAEYGKRVEAGDATAYRALASQPDLMRAAFQNMTDERAARITAIGDAARAVYPLRGTPEFKTAWAREMEGLRRNGHIDEATYRQWKDKPSELALQQALAMSMRFDQYQKAQSQTTAAAISKALTPLLSGTSSAGGPGPGRVDPYLAKLVNAEGGWAGKPSRTSTATGPVGFTEGTWNSLVRRHPELGFTAADRLDGRKQLLAEPALRRDNAAALAGAGIVPTDRNLYMAHFLGADGAARFLTGLGANPDRPAVDLVSPEAARANRGIFYSPGGEPLSAREVYAKLTDRFGDATVGISGLAPQRAVVAGPQTTINDRLAAAAPALARVALLPGVPESMRKSVLELAKAGIQYAQPTTTERDYLSYAREQRAQGKEPLGRLDWQMARSKAGATNVNVDTAGAREVQKGLAQRYLDAEDAARTAASEVRSYETLDKLLSDPNVYTGTAGEAIAGLKKMGSTLLGLNLKGVPNAEVARKITDELALQFKKKAADPQTSNYERQIYERMSVGLNDSAAGRALMVQLRIADARHLEQQAEIWRAHLRSNGSVDPEVFKALAEHEAARRKELSEFLDKANEVAATTSQPAPTAGAADVMDQLREKYQELRGKYPTLE